MLNRLALRGDGFTMALIGRAGKGDAGGDAAMLATATISSRNGLLQEWWRHNNTRDHYRLLNTGSAMRQGGGRDPGRLVLARLKQMIRKGL